MSDLFTYEVEHLIPFSREVYERMFVHFNEAWFPLHGLALLVGAILLWRAQSGRQWVVAALLAAAWLFTGVVFFGGPLAELLWASPWIGGAFAVQAALFGVVAWRVRQREPGPNVHDRIAIGTGALVLVAWPVLALASGRPWFSGEMFGLTPDPTVAVTLLLLPSVEPGRWWLWPIPLAWCVVSGAMGWTLGIGASLVLPAVAVLALGVAIARSLRTS